MSRHLQSNSTSRSIKTNEELKSACTRAAHIKCMIFMKIKSNKANQELRKTAERYLWPIKQKVYML